MARLNFDSFSQRALPVNLIWFFPLGWLTLAQALWGWANAQAGSSEMQQDDWLSQKQWLLRAQPETDHKMDKTSLAMPGRARPCKVGEFAI